MTSKTVFMRKIKTGLRFLGILCMRALLGIILGYLWLFAVAYIFHIAAGGGSVLYVDVIDYFYDSGPPRDGRYFGMAGAIYGLTWRVGTVGAWGFIAVGVIWGFSQGRLGLRRWIPNRST